MSSPLESSLMVSNVTGDFSYAVATIKNAARKSSRTKRKAILLRIILNSLFVLRKEKMSSLNKL